MLPHSGIISVVCCLIALYDMDTTHFYATHTLKDNTHLLDNGM